jgi:hypothetical protein
MIITRGSIGQTRRLRPGVGLLIASALCLPLGAADGRQDPPAPEPPPATAGQILISEFRLRGAGGTSDEFIELYNATGADHTVQAASGTGYGVAASDGTTRCTIPNGTVIPNRGHYLCVNSAGYSLAAYPAGNGTTATADATYTTDIPDNVGIALFNNNTGGGSYSLANRLDAVGSTAEANGVYKEGAGYPSLTSVVLNYSFTRKPPGGCSGSSGGSCASPALIQTTPGPATTVNLQDTNNNAADFLFVEPGGGSAGAGQRLGAPGPENLSSPAVSDGSSLPASRLSSCGFAAAAPNLVRDFAASPNASQGTLELRRTFTNHTGASLTRLRFRIVDVTAFPSIAGVADLRARSSTDTVVVNVPAFPCDSAVSNITVRGTTLETPPNQTFGGGYNSTLSVSAVTLAAPLVSGASVSVRFVLGIEQIGAARFCVVPETLPVSAAEADCFIGGTESSIVVARRQDLDRDGRAEMPMYDPATGQWRILKSIGGYTASSVISWGGAGYIPVPGDYDGDTVIDLGIYQPSTGTWSVLRSSSNYTRAFSIVWGGPSLIAVPGDYDGDGQTDITVHSTTNGAWHMLLSTSNYTSSQVTGWGGPSYTPVGGQDFDGDLRSDLVIYQERSGIWSVLMSSTNFTTGFTKTWGGPGYTLVPGDYNGDGLADFAIYQRYSGYWFVLQSPEYTSELGISWGGPGFLPVPADYDGDGRVDLGIYRPSTGVWSIKRSTSSYTTVLSAAFGTAAENPVSAAILPDGSHHMKAGDHDGDNRADITVYDTAGGGWLVLKSSAGYADATSRGWGGAGYAPVPGDYDGDGRTDLGLYQGATGTWSILLSGSAFTTVLSKGAGGAGWIPVPGDYDGDGKTDLVVYNAASGMWFGLKSSTNYTTTVNVGWGGTGYTATPGDFDGDGRTDLAIYRDATGVWSILTSKSNYTASITLSWGGAGYAPIQGDFDGDGICDFAVYQVSTGTWLALKSSTGSTASMSIGWGGAGYTPVAGDWDGDGRSDLAVYHQSSANWYILLSGASYTTTLSKNWGGPGYTALPRYP